MHINLIYKAEQRSASPVSLWLMLRVAIGAMLFLVVFGMFMFFIKYRALALQVEALDTEWKISEPKYKAAIQVRSDLAQRMGTLKALQRWRDVRISWGQQLGYLEHIIPDVIQLTDIRVSHTVKVVSNNIPGRVFGIKISGRTTAERSEVNVVKFLDGFKVEPFNLFVESAVLPPGAFRQDPLVKTDRIFEVICNYYPRLIE